MDTNPAEDAAVEVPKYRCHKVVRAAKITAFRANGDSDMPDLVLGEIGGVVTLLPDWHEKNKPQVGGYYVMYEDGYISYSPAKAFEDGYTAMSLQTPFDTFTQPKITGYRQLSPEEVALMNEGKALAERCGAFIEKLRAHVPENSAGMKPGSTLDQRWVSIGATDLQRGFMAVIRGIAQPTTF